MFPCASRMAWARVRCHRYFPSARRKRCSKSKWLAGLDRVTPRADVLFHIVGMNELSPAPVFHLLEWEPGEFDPLPVEVVDLTVRLRGENFLRHRFGHEMKPRAPLFGVPQSDLAIEQRVLESVVARLDARQHFVEPIHQHAEFVARKFLRANTVIAGLRYRCRGAHQLRNRRRDCRAQLR